MNKIFLLASWLVCISFSNIQSQQIISSDFSLPGTMSNPGLIFPFSNDKFKLNVPKAQSGNRDFLPSLLDTILNVGMTTYDLQTAASSGNRTYFKNDTIGTVWTYSPSLWGGFGDQSTGYNFYDGSSWGMIPSTGFDSVYFPNIDIGSDNTEYIVGNNFPTVSNDLILLKRNPAGTGPWQKSVLPPQPQGHICLWSKMKVGGANGSTIHVLSLTKPVSMGGIPLNGIDGVMTYSRSQDGGNTWDKVHEILIGIDQSHYKSMTADSYNLDVKGNTVAVVQGSYFNDWVLWKSTDNGDTWNENIIWTFSLPAYDINNNITDIDGDGTADTATFIDGSLAVLIDNNDVVHTWAGKMKSIQMIPGASNFAIDPLSDGLLYWNENFQGLLPEVLTSAIDEDTNSVITIEPFIPNYNLSLSSMPSAGIDASGNIILAYSAIRENTSSGTVNSESYRNTYCMISADGGVNWSAPANIYPSDFEEVVFPALARNIGTDINLSVQVDSEPGTSINDLDPVTVNDIRFISKNVNDLFAGVPITPFANLSLNGTLFFDQNQNGLKDAGDFGLSNLQVIAAPPITVTHTNNQGDFRFTKSPGAYTISTSPLSNWQLTTTNGSYAVNLVSGPVDSLDFGFYPISTAYNVSVAINPGAPRCNSQINYWLQFQNLGTTTANGTIRFIMDPQLSFVTSLPAFNSSSADTFSWNFSNLLPFEIQTIAIETGSMGLFAGDTVINTADILFNTSTTPAQNSTYVVQAINCSFDPNDKIVSPEGVDAPHYTLIGDTLNYTIRFQNTGTDVAYEVRIRDTLDQKLNLATFKLIGSSHPVSVTKNPTGSLLFKFENISLPDSGSNWLGSMGFVKYSIEPVAGIQPGSLIENTASIYFDYNSPVVTNTTYNTMVDVLGISENVSEQNAFQVSPNPFEEKLNLTFNRPLTEPHSIIIIDCISRVIVNQENLLGNQSVLMVPDMAPGFYIIMVNDLNGNCIGKQKIIKNKK